MKNKRHIIIPLCLLAYIGIMTWYFGRDLIASGQITRLITTVAVELVVIVILFFSLRKKQQLRNKRENQQ